MDTIPDTDIQIEVLEDIARCSNNGESICDTDDARFRKDWRYCYQFLKNHPDYSGKDCLFDFSESYDEIEKRIQEYRDANYSENCPQIAMIKLEENSPIGLSHRGLCFLKQLKDEKKREKDTKNKYNIKLALGLLTLLATISCAYFAYLALFK